MNQFLTDITLHPLSSLSITFLVWVWTRVFCGEIVEHQLDGTVVDQCSFLDLLGKEVVSVFMHGTFLHLIFEVFSIWHLRHVEMLVGTSFLLRYSLLYIFIEAVIRYVISASKQLKFQDLYLLPGKQGFSGLLIFWSILNLSAPTAMLGVITVAPVVLPILLLSFYVLFIPQTPYFSIFLSILFGLMIHFRVFMVLEDIYWNLSFIIDLFLVVTININYALPFRQNNDDNIDIENH